MKELRRYRHFKDQIIAERGGRCEACGDPADRIHHIIPIQQSGINSELVFEPANVMVLCDDCHCLMHPNQRRYPWGTLRIIRSHALAR